MQFRLRTWAVALVTACAAGTALGDGGHDVDLHREDQAETRRLDQLKGGYLLNFAKLTDWPAATSADALTFCFVGAAGIRDALEGVTGGMHIGQRVIALRTLRIAEPPDSCAVLYVEASAQPTERTLIGAVPASVLTVSNAMNFVQQGGIIELFSEGNRLRFKISLGNAQRAGLKISSRLLELASSVEQEHSK
jgi:hypothetical protein